MKLYTKQEVAELIGIHVRTIDKWRKENRGPRFIEIEGATIRCRQDDLREWIDKQTETSIRDEFTSEAQRLA